jgi:hypothetical protein
LLCGRFDEKLAQALPRWMLAVLLEGERGTVIVTPLHTCRIFVLSHPAPNLVEIKGRDGI